MGLPVQTVLRINHGDITTTAVTRSAATPASRRRSGGLEAISIAANATGSRTVTRAEILGCGRGTRQQACEHAAAPSNRTVAARQNH